VWTAGFPFWRIRLPANKGISYELIAKGNIKTKWDKALQAYFFPIETGKNYKINFKD